MKKKGLIISTVVMVIVLIASLTTATYAWFSSSAKASVSDMTMEAKAADGIKIGMKNNTTTTAPTLDDFVSGEVTWVAATSGKVNNDGTWTSPNADTFGTSVDPFFDGAALALAVDKAVTKNVGEDGTTPKEADLDADFIKAPDLNGDETKPGEFEVAVANVDYIKLDLGLIAATDDKVSQVIGTISVTPTDTARVGMAAAIHFEIQIKAPGETDWTTLAVAAYDGWEAGTSLFNKTSITTGQCDDNKVWTYAFEVCKKDTGLKTTVDDLCQVRILSWIDGDDESCRTTYTGTGATIAVNFDYAEVGKTQFTIANGVATQA